MREDQQISRSKMRDRDLPLVVGIGLILLSIGTVMGSISLGSYPVQNPIGVTYGAYLVTNYLIVLISVAIASAGIFLIYTAGKAAGSYIVEKGKAADNTADARPRQTTSA